MKWLSSSACTIFVQSIFIIFMLFGLYHGDYFPLVLGTIISIIHSARMLFNALNTPQEEHNESNTD